MDLNEEGEAMVELPGAGGTPELAPTPTFPFRDAALDSTSPNDAPWKSLLTCLVDERTRLFAPD